MPELPDLEILNRLVHDHCRGRRIAQAVAGDPGILRGISSDALEKRLKGEEIQSSARYGKHLFILFRGEALAMHFGTNGSLELVSRPGTEPPYTRLCLNFEEGDALAYVNPRRLGSVSLCESVESFVNQLGLGPDVLDPAFDRKAFTVILAGSKRDVKTVLMDQRLMAGLGNIYSDEILFQARIHPETAARDIQSDTAARLFSAMHNTLKTAIDSGADSERSVDQLPQDFLLPQRHRGGHCPRCGTALATLKNAGRTSYYCSHCQQK
jgi:formamidopyrimidine-DNA glycosylase